MTDLRTAAQQALEALQNCANGEDDVLLTRDALAALRAALAEPVLNPAPGYCKHCKQYTIEEPLPAEPVQEPFALPCPTPKACKAHCCSGHCVPRTNHPNHMTRIPPMLCIPHRIPDCPKCMSTHTAPPQRPAEPVQEPDLSRCPKCNGPADNGHDREVPPNPHYCTRCMADPVQEPVQEPVEERSQP